MSKQSILKTLQKIRVDWGPGNYSTKTFKDKSKYSRKVKHKKKYREDD